MVTGRVHAIAEVIVRGGMEDLFTFNSVALRAIGRKTRCGTFVVIRSSRKWTTAPDGWAEWQAKVSFTLSNAAGVTAADTQAVASISEPTQQGAPPH